MALHFDDISINTILGEGSFVKGDLHINGFTRIDGDIDGNLDTDGRVIIGAGSKIRGDIDALSATIGGIVLGNITVKESVDLQENSIVIGDIVARHVQIADKVIFHGHCISISEEEAFAVASEKFLQGKAIASKVEKI